MVPKKTISATKEGEEGYIKADGTGRTVVKDPLAGLPQGMLWGGRGRI